MQFIEAERFRDSAAAAAGPEKNPRRAMLEKLTQ